MVAKRILSLWFPRLAAERILRRRRDALPQAFAIVGDVNGAQVLMSLNAEAEAAGLSLGQPLRDATAIWPDLVTHPADPAGEAQFLTVLRRWAGKFSPWVAEEPPASLVIDLTGCAHLFGGEVALLREVEQDCADLGLTFRAGLADTPGAAWALARYAGGAVAPLRNGDAVEQEARATRARATKRRGWERGGDAPRPATPGTAAAMIAEPGHARAAIAGLPLAALRLDAEAVEGLTRLGLRRVSDIMGMPRAALARRFGADTLRRLDQALGLDPEPVTPARAPLHFAVRLTLPDPIGLQSDMEAAVDRLLPELCARLKAKGRGARKVQLQAFRCDGRVEVAVVGLARAADTVERIRPMLMLKLDAIDAGFGIDCVRLEAVMTEPLHALQHRGHFDATASLVARQTAPGAALDDLIGKLGARLRAEAVTRRHPAESHIPAKATITLAAAWSAPHEGEWPLPVTPRPLVMLRPEPVRAQDSPDPPARFRWRRRDLVTRMATGPERIQPEWWLDDPDWRSGVRDYWRGEGEGGECLWLYYATGGAVSGGWFCEGWFA